MCTESCGLEELLSGEASFRFSAFRVSEVLF